MISIFIKKPESAFLHIESKKLKFLSTKAVCPQKGLGCGCIWKGFEVSSKIIIPMAKNQTVDKALSIFSLNRFKVGCYHTSVSADFTPAVRYGCQEVRPNHLFESIVPMFNGDRNSHTPAFILPTEQHYYAKNLEFEKEKFEERIQALQEKNSAQTLLNPQPSSAYCQICKETYEQYLDHIRSKYHMRHLRASKANLFIDELVLMLNRKDQKPDQLGKTKPIRKTNKRKTETRTKKSSKPIKITEPTQLNATPPGPKINNYSTNIGSELAGTA